MNSKNYFKRKLAAFGIASKILILAACLGCYGSYAQDSCAGALSITAGTYTVTGIDGTNITTTTCSNASLAEWYAYTPTANYTVTVTSDLPQNICGDTNFSVYTGTCNGLSCYTEDDDSGTVACNNTGQTYLSKKTFEALAGVTYYIAWDNKWNTNGFDFQVIEAPFTPSPCYAATPITAGTVTVNAIDGTNVTTSCSSATLAKWYTYVPTQDYFVTITSDLPQNICKNTFFAVYKGSCLNGLTCVTSDDNSGNIACNSGNTLSNLSVKSFNVTAGTVYYIAWDNRGGADGFDFKLIESDTPCSAALPATAGTITVDAINGTNMTTSCSTASVAKWYAYTPSQDYFVTITSDLPQNICKDTNFSVYKGSCSGTLACVTSDDNSGTLACNSGNTLSNLSVKSFNVTAGTTYYIAWDNKWSADGFDFKIIESPTPCTAAIPVTAGLITVDAVNGTNMSTSCSTTSMAKWYAYVPAQDLHVTISSDLIQNICKDTNFSVYTGSCTGTLTCITSDDNSGTVACNSGNTWSNLAKKTFDVVGGMTYYIAWDNKWSANGFDFEISEAPIIVPVNYTSLSIPTINSSYNICVADMNGDFLDDIVGVSANSLKTHYQNPDGTFTAATYAVPGNSNMPGWSLAAGDLNKDGYNDLLLGSSNGLTFWKSNGNGTGYTADTPGDYIFCQRTNFVDIDNDGNLDAFSCHDIDPNVYYINDGNANMTYFQSGITPDALNLGIVMSGGNYASIWTDYDNDGDVDLFISKCSGPPCELHRNDNGVFTDVSVQAGISYQPVTSWSSAVGDFDNDGDMDILVGRNGSVNARLFRNELDTTNDIEEAFTNVSAGSGWDTYDDYNQDYVAYDFDNDGWLDILGAGNKIMFNQHDMSFLPTVYTNLDHGAIGDLNNDGFLDIQNGNTIRLAVPNGNHYLTVGLHGVQSNANGIAARVEIYGAWGKQIRDIRAGDGFRYMNSLNAHFGIGSATTIDKLVIRWPSGTIDVINNPSADSLVTVNEGAFPLAITEAGNEAFVIYPNPANDIINIRSASNAAIIKVDIFDLSGKQVMKKESINSTVPVNTLSAGTYIMKILDINGNHYTYKFVKS
ncbi:hypothetical protein HYN48_07150 [Flavobacterium magnum]|uniref:RNA-binding protein n=1 Tax=Flavobacterium magnum TaxID=2162713 RepID=A0A2S0RFK9_9FLAO|nr:FG-GAP-like repeat-containing protein [Flavobacterium magnum]AWA29871.1 hypothetical protein HYN48_07150 [Flavobacterium magnum]